MCSFGHVVLFLGSLVPNGFWTETFVTLWVLLEVLTCQIKLTHCRCIVGCHTEVEHRQIMNAFILKLLAIMPIPEYAMISTY